MAKPKVLFTQAHHELLHIEEDPEVAPETLGLRRLLVDLGFEPKPVGDSLTANHLEDSKVLVLGAPRTELHDEEVETIQHFVETGGGLLLVSDSYTMINPLDSLDQLAGMAGLQFHEYLNYHPTWLQLFFPHYITANVDRVKVKDVAYLTCSDGAYNLAVTKATRSTIIACASMGQGRVVAIGDVNLLTDLLVHEGNTTLVTNAFRWLASQNTVDIQEIIVPHIVKWGQSETVILRLYNGNAKARPQVECILESDLDALISEPASKRRSIPPGKTTQMQWTVTPQTLGDQKLRLTINITGQPSLYFDQLLPEMCCEASGYLTLQTRNAEGEPETEFQTGDQVIAEGALHWPTGLESPSYQLELEHTEGLIKRGYQPGEGVGRWHLQAVAPGTHTLTLKICQTGQSLPAMVTVQSSLQDQLSELRAAYVHPLDAEIAERLQAVDQRLSDEAVRGQPFTVLPPDQYIQEVYDTKAAIWLKEVLTAARREQWYNLDLLNEVLIYLAPAYLPGKGSFVPYDSSLASHLARLHPTKRWRLECNLVRSEESEDINVRQNIATYLLHEKYGHGFFYTHTCLGQQLAILQRHGFLEEPHDESYKDYVEAARLIKDSAVIVNEGFAAWMELAFLGKLDREVRQAVLPRRVLLLQEATGLYERQRDSRFFQTFPPRFDSPYREGFEYLDFVSQHFNLCCAVRVFLIATNVEFGISEDDEGHIQFEQEVREIERRLLEAEEDDARSHLRLSQIGELVYDRRKEMQAFVRKRHCPEDCKDYCPLEKLIEENLKWRRPHD